MSKSIFYLLILQLMFVTNTVFGETADLAEDLMNADQQDFLEIFPRGILFENVVRRIKPHLPAFVKEVQQKLLPTATLVERLRLANRQANAAVVLLKLDQPENVWPLLEHNSDPTTRSIVIHRMGPFGVPASTIMARLNVESDNSIRRALILSLGEFDERALPIEERTKFLPTVRDFYRLTPDAGLHAACEWLLKQWNDLDWLKQAVRELPGVNDRGESKWYVNNQGHSMVVITGPIRFLMSSREGELDRGADEAQHEAHIDHTFAISSKEVTVAEFRRFKKYHFYNEHHARDTSCPVNEVNWYDAVEYCNWMNVQEDIPRQEWCYEPNSNDEYKAGMTTVEDYLKRSGYRLPTEVEWEYACRADSETRFSFGEEENLQMKFASIRDSNSLERYSNVFPDQTYPVGSFKPNDFGLFDMHGNVQEWCQDAYCKNGSDQQKKLSFDADPRHVLRGGSFCSPSWAVRSATRDHFAAWYREGTIGFRIARTLTNRTEALMDQSQFHQN